MMGVSFCSSDKRDGPIVRFFGGPDALFVLSARTEPLEACIQYANKPPHDHFEKWSIGGVGWWLDGIEVGPELCGGPQRNGIY